MTVESINFLQFQYVQEWSDEFLALFPHRFDYIWAPHPSPGVTVEWKTESRHPLSDRVIQQGSNLYGVRFGAQTNYCLIDIDAGSNYHPKRDPFAIARIAAALEPLGLVSYVACTSSYSSGLHLYFPFQQAQSSWQLAIAVACSLENAGFKLQPGQLETFPNPKPYATESSSSLFNAHRLPLQMGSYLLNQAGESVWSDAQSFISQWKLAQCHSDVDRQTLQQTLKQAKRKHFGISGRAEKFVNDLNAEIELGWTGAGQTNRLLGRITMRAYIFHHMLSGGEPLHGAALVSEIVATARSLPGYEDWCRHRHEIEHRAEEWARCIENSHYFQFGDQSQKPKLVTQNPELRAAIDQLPSWNQRQLSATRERIRSAIGDLLEQNSLPIKPTARFQALLKYGIGGASLYRHRDLWHPTHFGISASERESTQNTTDVLDVSVENPPHPPKIKLDRQLDCEATSNCLSPTSLLSNDGGKRLLANASNDPACTNTCANASNTSITAEAAPAGSNSLQAEIVRQALCSIQIGQNAFQDASHFAHRQYQHIKADTAQQRQKERMQRFLDSGDPILMAEARAWAQSNPDLQVQHPQ